MKKNEIKKDLQKIKEQKNEVVKEGVFDEDSGTMVKIVPELEEKMAHLDSMIKNSFVQISMALHIIKVEKLYTQHTERFKTYKAYYEHLGLKKRDAYKKAAVGSIITEANLNDEQFKKLEDLGASKTYTLMRLSAGCVSKFLDGSVVLESGVELKYDEYKNLPVENASKLISEAMQEKPKVAHLKADNDVLKAEKKALEAQKKELEERLADIEMLDRIYGKEEADTAKKRELIKAASEYFSKFLYILNRIKLNEKDGQVLIREYANLYGTIKTYWTDNEITMQSQLQDYLEEV